MAYTRFSVFTKQGIEERSIIYQYQQEYRWLSNFWPCHVILPGEQGLPDMAFDNVEKAYMAWKTLDYETRLKIQTMGPGDAKKESRKKDFKLRSPYTNEMRIQAMEMLASQKFSKANPELLQKLLDTKGTILAEGNLHDDTFFGIDLNLGYGDNHLGRTQMKIRAQRLNEI